MMTYVQRSNGVVTGLYANPQPGYAEERLADDHPDVAAYWERLERLNSVSRTAALIALYRKNGITEGDIESEIASIPDPGDRYEAGLRFRSPTWERSSMLLMQLAAAFDLPAEDVNALFVAAASLDRE